jgi:F0F1-type ATP synthase membrane subunit b/b'
MHSTRTSFPLFRNLIVVLAVFIGLGAACAKVYFSRASHGDLEASEQRRREIERERQRQEARYQAELEQSRKRVGQKAAKLLEDARREDLESLGEIRNALRKQVESRRSEALSHSGAIAKELGSFNGVSKCSVLMVRDLAKGTEMYPRAMAAALEPVSQPMVLVAGDSDTAFSKLLLAVREHSTRISTELIQYTGSLDVTDSTGGSEVQKAIGTMADGIQSHQVELGAGIALAPLEFGGVVAVGKLLTLALGKQVQRAMATAGANAVLVAADGPLPVGDAVAMGMDLGSLAWTAYDLHKISSELPGKIEAQLRTAVESAYAGSLVAFDKVAQELLARAAEQRQRALASVIDPVAAQHPIALR